MPDDEIKRSMSADAIKQAVIENIAFLLDESPNSVKVDDSDTWTDIGLDSLDMVEGVMRLEDQFDVEILDKDAEQLKTVGDVVRFLAQTISDGKATFYPSVEPPREEQIPEPKKSTKPFKFPFKVASFREECRKRSFYIVEFQFDPSTLPNVHKDASPVVISTRINHGVPTKAVMAQLCILNNLGKIFPEADGTVSTSVGPILAHLPKAIQGVFLFNCQYDICNIKTISVFGYDNSTNHFCEYRLPKETDLGMPLVEAYHKLFKEKE